MPQIANGEAGASARAKLNAVLPQAVAFAIAVPLDGRKVMAAQTIAGVLAFTPAAGPAIGGDCYVRLTADGTNAPTFAGFTEHGSSAGFYNAVGVVNMVRFWYDGTASWFAVAQALNVVPFVIQAAAIASATPSQIQLTFGVAMNTSVTPAASTFTVATTSGGSPVTDAATAVAWTNSTTLTITKSRATLAADTVALTYAPPGSTALVDTNGNAVSGSTISVQNNVSAAAGGNFLQMTNKQQFTETSDSGGGYDYLGTSSSYGAPATASAAVKLASGADGWFQATLGANPNGDGPMIGFATAPTGTSINSVSYGIYAGTGAGQPYVVWPGSGNPTTPQNCAAGDTIRLTRTGGTLVATLYRSGSTTALPLHTFTQTIGGLLYPAIAVGAGNANNLVRQPLASSNVA